MMKKRMLYVHDHIFIKDDRGNYYSEGNFTDAVFARYDPFASELYVLCRYRKASALSELSKIEKTNLVFRPVKGLTFFKIFSTSLFCNFKKALKLVRASDAIIVRLPSFLGSFVYLLAKACRRSYFVELVGDPREAIVASVDGKKFGLIGFLAIFMEKITGSAVLAASGVVYVTEKTLQNKFPTRGFTAVASNVELTIEHLELGREYYSLDNVPINIGMIGSFSKNYKGIDVAIRAISELVTRGVNCQLRILGSGDAAEYLALADSLGVLNNIFFDGVRETGKAVYTWLDSLDLYIQPSRTEGLPRSLIEAMSRGLPCVGSNVGGIPELIPEEWIFQKNSHLELVEKIVLFIHSLETRYRAGLENYENSKRYRKEVLQESRKIFWEKANAYVNNSANR